MLTQNLLMSLRFLLSLLFAFTLTTLSFGQIPSLSIATSANPICAGNNTTLTASTNVSNATFLWMPGALTSPSITVSPGTTTTYTCTVSANNLSNSSSATIIVNPLPTGSVTVNTNGTLVANSMSTPSSYMWSNGVTTQTNNTYFFPGTYCVIITNALGCNSAPICATVQNPTVVYSNAGQDGTISCTQNQNGYQLGTTPIAGHTYAWSPTTGLNNPNIANPIALPSVTTTYTLTQTDANGNQVIDQVVVIVNNTPPTINAGPDQTVCQGANVTLNAVSNAPNISWNNGVLNNVPFVANNIGTTTFTATATAANGCVSTDQVLVTVNPTPVATVTASGPLALCPGQSVTLCAYTTQIVGYMWCNGASTQCITVSTPGNYCLVLQGLNGCLSSAINTIITVGNNATANAGPDVSINCSSTTAGVTIGSPAQAGSVYTWSPASGLNNPNIANPIANPGATTTYTLTVTNSSGCTATDQVVVTVNNTLPTINAGPDQTVCQGANVTLNAISNVPNISWNNGVFNNVPFVANNIGTTTFTATATAANGCVSTDQVLVTVNPIPVATITASGPLALCPGSSVVLSATASPGCAFQWKKNGLPQSNGNTANFIAFQPGTYTVTVSNSNGCSSTSNSVVVSLLQASIQALGPTTICQGSSVVLQATNGNGYTYQWVKNGNPSLSFGTSATYNANSSGTYSVNIMTPSGCLLSSNQIQIQVLLNPTINIFATGSTTICSGSSLTLLANSTSTSLSYQWKKNGVAIVGATGSFYSVTQAGTYTLVVANAACPTNQVSSNAITVNVNPSPTPTITATTLLIAPGASATLSTPLVAGQSYQWQQFNGNIPLSIPGANSNTYTTSLGATYRVKATNTFGCSGYSPQLTLVNTQMPEIESPKLLAINSDDQIQVFPNPNNGQFTIVIPAADLDQQLHVTDINGRCLKTIQLDAIFMTMDIQELANGTYWLLIGNRKPIQIVKH